METNPDSPGAFTSFRIRGWPDGVVPLGVRTSAVGGPVTAALEPNNTIKIYAGDATCANPSAIVKEGTAAELENPGIEVTVATGSTTTFYATQSGISETSECSHGITYRHVTGPPSMPTVSTVNPVSGSDNNAPRVSGSADSEALVSIYADSNCTGTPLVSSAGSIFSGEGIPVDVEDNSTTTFHAKASWASFESVCSITSVTYEEVTAESPPPPPPPPPADEGDDGGTESPPGQGQPQIPPTPGRPAPPKLRTVPGGRANNSSPLVAGNAPGAVRVQIYKGDQCDGNRVTEGSIAELANGLAVQVAENATTRFSGIAIDSDGERSNCSSSVAYTEDSTPPQTRITLGPGVKTRKRTAVFRFTDVTDDPPGTTFACKLDHGPWRGCQTPWRVPRLRPKQHTVRVKATDLAGNEEAIGTKHRFKVIAG